MAVIKKNLVLMTATIIIVMLVLIFASLLFLSPNFEIKDGKIMIPDDPLVTLPTTESKATTSEGLTFKGTFNWEEKDGISEEDKSTCYLRIYTFDGITMGDFSFGEHQIDGWPTYLVSHTGKRYILESSNRSLVEKVRIVIDVTDTGMSGTIENITPKISNFVRGSFTGKSIPFKLYAAEVLN